MLLKCLFWPVGFLIHHTVGSSRLFPKFRNLLVTWYVRTERSRLINQSDQRILFALCHHDLSSSAKTFHAVIVLFILRNSSRISTFDTSVRNGTESNHCHCLVWVILSFHFTVFGLTKSGSQEWTTGQNSLSMELSCVLDRTHIYLLATRQKRL